ncbi:MAG TPA: 50S ribosomal protein L9 [bacterium]|jgi:large subunit ribosomal protein L9|nr:50S ribosomal protein L9 [bacterium]
MKVLLKNDVPKIGKKGELLDVKEGYARNFLIPNGLAIEATGGTMKQYEEEKKSADRRKAKEKEDAQALAVKIKGLTITLRHKAGDEGRLFGSITSAEVAEALKQKGFEIDKKKIHLDEPIRLVGKHEAKVKLHAEVSATLNVEVMKL